MATPLTPHLDRLLPTSPEVRAIARELFAQVEHLPIVSPHGHVPAQWLSEDQPFGDPTSLLISPDHYLTRLLHSAGVPLETLGVGGHVLDEAGSRAAWRTFCDHWPVYRGTQVRYWIENELAGIFGITERPSADSADRIYDALCARLAEPAYRPRALFDRFGIEVLATTDDPCDNLVHHEKLAADETFTGTVVPSFRPDRYLEPGRPDWNTLVDALGAAADTPVDTWAGFLDALRARRRYFIEHGAVSADHSHADVVTVVLEPAEAGRLYDAARAGTATPEQTTALRRHLLTEMAGMSVEDGLVMTLHPGIYRNHSSATLRSFGPDSGHDIPMQVEFTRGLQPLLDRYGLEQDFHLVLFTVDETTFSREIAPLAGFYPSVYAGAPWWFIDAPDAVRRYRAAITDDIGFYRTSGFIDDTRAFCSIPARHDMSRRLDCGFLAELVAEHRIELDEAQELAVQLVTDIPRKAFKL
ncbi:glucuronate isomerase [Flexivirga oryzae]|uniref:Uronate isomerase n=1 Tax=Flexivirga oryzae TaxID=1794944 RepID=A0A839NCM9_9MICO|nr:glucuronate isomerase [Flexivirga oryzae]MBB2894619.1 glucuronate isomerase [Flexivirga oryzae]